MAGDESIHISGELGTDAAFYRNGLEGTPLKPSDARYFVAKVDASGSALWVHTYGSSLHSNDSWRPPTLMPDGAVVLSGAHSRKNDLGYVERLDGGGRSVWLREFEDRLPAAEALAPTPEGDVIAVGWFRAGDITAPPPRVEPPDTIGQFIAKLDGETGAILWIRRSYEPEWKAPSSVDVPADGFPVLTVVRGSPGGLPHSILRLDPNGERGPGSWLWHRPGLVWRAAPIDPDGVAAFTSDGANVPYLTILRRSTGTVEVNIPVGAEYFDIASRGDIIVGIGAEQDYVRKPPGSPGFEGRAAGATMWRTDGSYVAYAGWPGSLHAHAVTLDARGSAYVTLSFTARSGETVPLGPPNRAPTFKAPEEAGYLSILKLDPPL